MSQANDHVSNIAGGGSGLALLSTVMERLPCPYGEIACPVLTPGCSWAAIHGPPPSGR